MDRHHGRHKMQMVHRHAQIHAVTFQRITPQEPCVRIGVWILIIHPEVMIQRRLQDLWSTMIAREKQEEDRITVRARPNPTAFRRPPNVIVP